METHQLPPLLTSVLLALARPRLSSPQNPTVGSIFSLPSLPPARLHGSQQPSGLSKERVKSHHSRLNP